MAPPVAGSAPPVLLAAPDLWRGKVVVDGANLRSAPKAQAPVVGQLPAGSPLIVSAWVEGDQVVADNPAWAQVNDQTFIYSAEIRPVDLPSAPPVPAVAPTSGRWVDVNLTQQVAVAYDGRTLVRMARTSTPLIGTLEGWLPTRVSGRSTTSRSGSFNCVKPGVIGLLQTTVRSIPVGTVFVSTLLKTA